MQEIDAVILAGGLGTRLRPVVDTLPKALAPVGGRPFLDILLGYLNRCRIIRRVVIAAGFMADKIISRYDKGCGYNFELAFSLEETLLGTGGAVIKAVNLHTQTPLVIALNGDTFAEVDFEDFTAAHLRSGADMTIALKEIKDSGRYGSVTLDTADRVVSFQEKTAVCMEGLINAGVYVFDRGLFDGRKYCEGTVISLEREILPQLSGNIYGYRFEGRFIDIGVPESYNIAGEYLSDIT